MKIALCLVLPLLLASIPAAAIEVLLSGSENPRNEENPNYYMAADGVPVIVFDDWTSEASTFDFINGTGGNDWHLTLQHDDICADCENLSVGFWSFATIVEPNSRQAIFRLSIPDPVQYGTLIVSVETDEILYLHWDQPPAFLADFNGDGLDEVLTHYYSGWSLLGVSSTAVPQRAPDAGALRLYPNSPNPFNPRTTIDFALDRDAEVRVEIHDPAGRLVDEMDLGLIGAGRHQVDWAGRDRRGRSLATGVYHYSVVADGERRSRRMLLLK